MDTSPGPSDRPSSGRPTVVLLTCCVSVFVAGLDVTIANVALPSIHQALHAQVNVPIGALAIYLTQRFVPESRAARGRRFDPLGQLLVVTVIGPVTAAIIEGPRRGWASPLIIGLFALAAASAAGLVVAERRRTE